MNIYLLFFLFIVAGGLIISYLYFMKEKKQNLQTIQQGICPKCHQKSMELTDQRGTGCKGPKILTFECQECHYINTFSVESGGGCSC